jgi:hypothetical protein
MRGLSPRASLALFEPSSASVVARTCLQKVSLVYCLKNLACRGADPVETAGAGGEGVSLSGGLGLSQNRRRH